MSEEQSVPSTDNKAPEVPSLDTQSVPVLKKSSPLAAHLEAARAASSLPTYDQINKAGQGKPALSADDIAKRISERSKSRGEQRKPFAKRKQNDSNQPQAEGTEATEATASDAKPQKNFSERGSRPRREKDSAPRESRPRRDFTKVERKTPVPNLRKKDDSDEEEISALFDNQDFETVLKETGADTIASQEILDESTKVTCKVEKVTDDTVFVNIGTRDLGAIPLKQFPPENIPEVGATFDAVAIKHNNEGLYEVALPLAAAEIGDWMSVTKGAIVEATITGSNAGGLECKVGNLRGFMPMSQIDRFHVEQPEQFVGEKWRCIVTEVNPMRRNLVVSRRKLIVKEREEQQEEMFAKLEVGQILEGSVRKMIDVGAFISLGPIDGFLPISQMSWGRVDRPEDVLHEGDQVRVQVLRIDTDKKRVSLSLKATTVNPWDDPNIYLDEGSIMKGRVVMIKPFGAFIELFPGVEGMVHISEIAYKRVGRIEDALDIGDVVDVKLLAVNRQDHQIKLSIKQTQEDPMKVAEREANDAAAKEQAQKDAAADEKLEKIHREMAANEKKLKGGLRNEGSAGDRFGLKW